MRLSRERQRERSFGASVCHWQLFPLKVRMTATEIHAKSSGKHPRSEISGNNHHRLRCRIGIRQHASPPAIPPISGPGETCFRLLIYDVQKIAAFIAARYRKINKNKDPTNQRIKSITHVPILTACRCAARKSNPSTSRLFPSQSATLRLTQVPGRMFLFRGLRQC